MSVKQNRSIVFHGIELDLVGKRADTSSFPFQNYSIQLLAGGTVISEDDNSLDPAVGTFINSTVTLTTDSTHPQLGQQLEVRLSALPSNREQVNFDDVRLDAIPVSQCEEFVSSGIDKYDLTDMDGDGKLDIVYRDGAGNLKIRLGGCSEDSGN